MSDRPRILSISFSNYLADARVLRQLDVLAEYGDVTTIGFGPKPQAAFEHLQLQSGLKSLPQSLIGVVKLALRMHTSSELQASGNRAALQMLAGRKFDLIVANEARALPLAHAVAEGAPIWGDMHEWAPEERTNVLSWRVLVAPFMRHVCEKYLPLTDEITTVNGSIAQLYEDQFGVKVDVVRNAIALQNLTPSAMVDRRIRLVHSGAAVPGRSIETLIEATIAADDRFSLDLYLVKAGDGGKYWQKLRDLARASDKIVFHDPVPPEELPATLNAYDVGVFVFRPTTINHRFMLPNKFFDFVQARLAIIFSPAVETSALIEKHKLGVITEDVTSDSLVKALSALTSESVAKFKDRVHEAAAELSSAHDERVQRKIIERLLGGVR
jgi:hypothetical protein